MPGVGLQWPWSFTDPEGCRKARMAHGFTFDKKRIERGSSGFQKRIARYPCTVCRLQVFKEQCHVNKILYVKEGLIGMLGILRHAKVLQPPAHTYRGPSLEPVHAQ